MSRLSQIVEKGIEGVENDHDTSAENHQQVGEAAPGAPPSHPDSNE